MEIEFEKWKDEYLPNELEDDDKMYHIKEAVDSLNSIQKKIWLLYTEIGSYAGLARELGVCSNTAKKYIKKLRKMIYDRL